MMCSVAASDFHPIPQFGDEGGPRPSIWTAFHAASRFIAAFEVARLLRGREGPRGDKGYWPQTFHTQVDLAWQRELTAAEQKERENEKNHVREYPTAAQMALLDRVNGWMLDYCHAGHSVQVLTAYALHCAKGRDSRWWPEDDFQRFADFLNARREAVI